MQKEYYASLSEPRSREAETSRKEEDPPGSQLRTKKNSRRDRRRRAKLKLFSFSCPTHRRTTNEEKISLSENELPEPSKQAEVITTLVNRFPAPFHIGEQWYVISCSWLRKWLAYTGCKAFTAMPNCPKSDDEPGSIDNSSLKPCNCYSSVDPKIWEKENPPLPCTALRNDNYLAVHPSIWDQLYSWYGANYIIRRQTVRLKGDHRIDVNFSPCYVLFKIMLEKGTFQDCMVKGYPRFTALNEVLEDFLQTVSSEGISKISLGGPKIFSTKRDDSNNIETYRPWSYFASEAQARKGDRVFAFWKGRWYPGSVTNEIKDDNSIYKVLCDVDAGRKSTPLTLSEHVHRVELTEFKLLLKRHADLDLQDFLAVRHGIPIQTKIHKAPFVTIVMEKRNADGSWPHLERTNNDAIMFREGSDIDCLSSDGKWRQATVCKESESHITVRYVGSERKEAVKKFSKRLTYPDTLSRLEEIRFQDTTKMLQNIYMDVYRFQSMSHSCSDGKAAIKAGTKLLYGEIRAEGVRKLMDRCHLRGSEAKMFVDVGSGRGRVCLQVFELYPNISRVVGVEISANRFSECCIKAVPRFVNYCERRGDKISMSKSEKSLVIVVENETGTRKLEFYNADIGSVQDKIQASEVDIANMNVAFNKASTGIKTFLLGLRDGARISTYTYICGDCCLGITDGSSSSPFKHIAKFDSYKTSWSLSHPFYLWQRVRPTEDETKAKMDEDKKEAKAADNLQSNQEEAF